MLMSFCVVFVAFVVPSAGPAGLNVSATSSVSLRVTWDQVESCCRHGIIRGYYVLFADHKLQRNISYTMVNESTHSFEFHNLYPNYAYHVSVTAFTIKGIGPASAKTQLTGEGGNMMIMKTKKFKTSNFITSKT